MQISFGHGGGRVLGDIARTSIVETLPSADGLVRKVRVRTSSSTYERPITKIVLVYRPESPTREP